MATHQQGESDHPLDFTRRTVLGGLLATPVVMIFGTGATKVAAASPIDVGIKSIEREVIFSRTEIAQTFGPLSARLPANRHLLLTQAAIGSDNFEGPHWSEQAPDGKSWSQPQPIPGLARRDVEGVPRERLVHTFSDLDVNARYIKVNTRYSDTAWTFAIDARAQGILSYGCWPTTGEPLPALIGQRVSDVDPANGTLQEFGELSGLAVDWNRRSIGLDLGEVRTVQAVVLTERDDTSSRLVRDDYTVWASEDNVTYEQVNDWSFDAEVQTRTVPREESVAAPLPGYHERTGRVLAMGTNVWYEHNVIVDPYKNRYIIYATRDWNGGPWSERKKLEWDNPDATGMYYCSGLQRYTFEDGNILVPVQYLPLGRRDFASTTLLCSFDGETVEVIAEGTELRHPVGRGVFEPSVTPYGSDFYLTMRAEDERAYVSVSSDGLAWGAKTAWTWDDGEPLVTGTTQQHWVTHRHGLFLVYTRRAPDYGNEDFFRWRAPLFIARVDPTNRSLIRETERVVIPLDVGGSGNFGVTNISPMESLVFDGAGDTVMATIRWSIPNDLVTPFPRP